MAAYDEHFTPTPQPMPGLLACSQCDTPLAKCSKRWLCPVGSSVAMSPHDGERVRLKCPVCGEVQIWHRD